MPVLKRGDSEKTSWLILSSLRKTTLPPSGSPSTWGRNSLLRCTTIFFAVSALGIDPSSRFSVTTAPPGPPLPPPLTVPSTVVSAAAARDRRSLGGVRSADSSRGGGGGGSDAALP